MVLETRRRPLDSCTLMCSWSSFLLGLCLNVSREVQHMNYCLVPINSATARQQRASTPDARNVLHRFPNTMLIAESVQAFRPEPAQGPGEPALQATERHNQQNGAELGPDEAAQRSLQSGAGDHVLQFQRNRSATRAADAVQSERHTSETASMMTRAFCRCPYTVLPCKKPHSIS